MDKIYLSYKRRYRSCKVALHAEAGTLLSGIQGRKVENEEYLKYFFDDFLLVMEASLKIFHIEFEEIKWSGSRLSQHVSETDVLANH